MEERRRLRITTWNVNGIRNPFGYQPWRRERTFAAMFEILDADIVVMQETKIQRKDLQDDMVLVPGWDVYFSLPKHKKGYSGVAIYTRSAICAPIRAEEGITGILTPPNSPTSFCHLPGDQRIGGYPSRGQLAGFLDSEGRDSEGPSRSQLADFPDTVTDPVIRVVPDPITLDSEGRSVVPDPVTLDYQQIGGYPSHSQLADFPDPVTLDYQQIGGYPSHSQLADFRDPVTLDSEGPSRSQLADFRDPVTDPVTDPVIRVVPDDQQISGYPSRSQLADFPSRSQLSGFPDPVTRDSERPCVGYPSRSQLADFPSRSQLSGFPDPVTLDSERPYVGYPSRSQLDDQQIVGYPSHSQLADFPSRSQLADFPDPVTLDSERPCVGYPSRSQLADFPSRSQLADFPDPVTLDSEGPSRSQLADFPDPVTRDSERRSVVTDPIIPVVTDPVIPVVTDPVILDSEGRCVVLEFPAFVLIGVYCPANRDESRDEFRLGFLNALDARVRNLVAAGKRVFLAGDLNIIRDEIDTASMGEQLRKQGITVEDYVSTPARRLLNHLIVGGRVIGDRDEGREKPLMWDLCRSFHPTRRGMFTCWEQKINARPGNYGSRIDYVLCGEDWKDWFSDSNIQEGLMGSDHCPVYAILKETVEIDGREVDIRDLMSADMFKNGVRQREWTTKDLLPTSARLIPEFDRRRNIRDMFANKLPPSLPKGEGSGSTSSSPAPAPAPALPKRQNELSVSGPAKKSKGGQSGKAQQQSSLMGFFRPKTPEPEQEQHNNKKDVVVVDPIEAKETWSKILGNRVPPRCGDHDEPCISMVTKKPGVNRGRSFYMCPRPLGPTGRKEKNSQWQCGTFIWSSDWTPGDG